MHELSLVHALFDEADRAIGAHPRAAVRELHVRVGELAGVEPELFRTAFDDCHAERGYEGARLVITHEPAAWRCRTCEGELGAGPLRCPRCGDNGDVALTRGDALVLDRIELEVAAAG